MASYTLTVEAKDEADFEAYCTGKGYANSKAFLDDLLKSHVDTANAYAAQSDEVAKAAKLAEYDTIKPTADKIAALKAEEAAIVQKLIDGEITAADVTVAAVEEKP